MGTTLSVPSALASLLSKQREGAAATAAAADTKMVPTAEGATAPPVPRTAKNWRTNTPATAGEIGGRGRVGRGRGRGNGRRGGKENRANKAGNPPAAAAAAQPLKLRTPEAADRSTASRSPKWRDRTRVPKEPPWILNFFTAITTHRIALCVH